MAVKLAFFVLSILAIQLVLSKDISLESIHDDATDALTTLECTISDNIDAAKNQINETKTAFEESASTILTGMAATIGKKLKANKDAINEAKSEAEAEGRDRSVCDKYVKQINDISTSAINEAKDCINTILDSNVQDAYIIALADLGVIEDEMIQFESDLDLCGTNNVCNAELLDSITAYDSESPICIGTKFVSQIEALTGKPENCRDNAVESAGTRGSDCAKKAIECYAS